MRFFIFLVAILTLNGCNSDKKPDAVKGKSVTGRSELSKDSKIFLGNRLFSEKTCITCHSFTEKKVGPSVVDIMSVYKEKNASIEAFLKGNSKPIVDTAASQVAIMQDNIDGFLKKVSDEELNEIDKNMQNVFKSNSK